MKNVNMGLDNFSFQYSSDFEVEEDDMEYKEFEMTKEYLRVIRDDLKRLVLYVDEINTDFNKQSLIKMLNSVIDSILLDVWSRPREYEKQEELLSLKVNDDYVMFEVFDSYYFKNVKEAHKPLKVFMSKKLNDMRFYFIEEVKQENKTNSMCVSRYILGKDNILMDSKYITDYNFIDLMAMDKTNECVLELNKRLK